MDGNETMLYGVTLDLNGSYLEEVYVLSVIFIFYERQIFSLDTTDISHSSMHRGSCCSYDCRAKRPHAKTYQILSTYFRIYCWQQPGYAKLYQGLYSGHNI